MKLVNKPNPWDFSWKRLSHSDIKKHLDEESENTNVHYIGPKAFCSKDIKKWQKGYGKNPSKEWLINPSKAPIKHHNSTDEYRYYHGHHKDLIPAMKTGKKIPMPIVHIYKDGSYCVLTGRHRIAYAVALNKPVTVYIVKQIEENSNE